MKSEHINPFLEATINVIETMAMLKPVAGKPFLKSDKKANGDVSGIIGMTGHRKGAIVLSFSEAAAIKIVSAMIYEEQTEIGQDVLDAVGELTNQVSGDARRRLSVLGMNFEAGLPTVISGPGHLVETMCKSPIVAIPFVVDGCDFVVEATFED